MRISVRTQLNFDVGAGAISGRELLSKLLSLTVREPDVPESVVLDFAGIEVATASFLRESVIAFRNIIRGRRSKFYPIVANLKPVIAEELEDILQARSDAIMSCVTTDDGEFENIQTLGRLEAKQKRVLELVSERGELDAGQLQREFGDSEGVKQTAWNNRLSALATSGLVIEISDGKNKRYKPLFEGA